MSRNRISAKAFYGSNSYLVRSCNFFFSVCSRTEGHILHSRRTHHKVNSQYSQRLRNGSALSIKFRVYHVDNFHLAGTKK